MSKTKFGFGEAIGLLLALLGLGIQLQWPEQRWLGTVFIALGVALGLGMIVWIVAQRKALGSQAVLLAAEGKAQQRIKQKQVLHAPISTTSTNAPVFANVFAPRLSQEQAVPAKLEPKSTREPVFECRSITTRRYGLNLITGELIREQYEGDPSTVYDHIRFVDAILAKFYYRADPGVDPRLRLNAHVFIYEIDPVTTLTDDPPKSKVEIYKPVWDDDEPHVSHAFSAGYDHELIVALVPVNGASKSIVGYEYDTKKVSTYMGTEREFYPRLHSLEGQFFRIRIELIPKLHNEVRCTIPPFWIAVSLEHTLKLGLLPKPSDKRHLFT